MWGAQSTSKNTELRKAIGTFWNPAAQNAMQALVMGWSKIALEQANSQAWVVSHHLHTGAVKCTFLPKQDNNTPNQRKCRSQKLPQPQLLKINLKKNLEESFASLHFIDYLYISVLKSEWKFSYKRVHRNWGKKKGISKHNFQKIFWNFCERKRRTYYFSRYEIQFHASPYTYTNAPISPTPTVHQVNFRRCL